MDIDSILSEAETAIREAADEQSLDEVRVRFLGKKGELTALLKGLGALDPEERPKAGAAINVAKATLAGGSTSGRTPESDEQLSLYRQLAAGSVPCLHASLCWFRVRVRG